MREAGIPHDNLIREHGVSFMVRRVEVEYCRPARLDELVHVLTRVTAVGGASVRLRQDVVGGGDAVCVSLELRMACVAVATGRAAAMPARWRAVLSRMADGEAG
jgi:acyl-CoA thioester hydrolase